MPRELAMFADFRGGLNTDAADDLIADNELTVAENVELGMRGGIAKRRGTQKLNAASYGAKVSQLIEWPRMSGGTTLLAVIGKSLHSINEETYAKTLVKALASDRIGYVFFKNSVYFVDGNGFYRYDGSAVSSVPAKTTQPITSEIDPWGGWTQQPNVDEEVRMVVSSGTIITAKVAVKPELEAKTVQLKDLSGGAMTDIVVNKTTFRFTGEDSPNADLFMMVVGKDDGTSTVTLDYKSETEVPVQNDLTAIRRCKFLLMNTRTHRMFAAGDPQYPSTMYYSELGDPTWWKPTSSLVPTLADGPITGLAMFGDSVLVFFPNAIWAWRGLDPETDAVWERLSTSQGTPAVDSLALTSNSLTYLSTGGVFAISPSMLSMTAVMMPGEDMVANLCKNKVAAIINGITKPAIACGVWDQVNQRYLLSYSDLTDGSKNNKVLAYDWTLKAFAVWTGLEIWSWLSRLDGTVLAGTHDGYIVKLGVGSTDYNGASIPMVAETKPFAFQVPNLKKRYWGLYVDYKQNDIARGSLTAKLKVDGTVTDTFADPVGRQRTSRFGYRASVRAENSTANPCNVVTIGIPYAVASEARTTY